eukprot:TRINITY_DN67988_c3_g3_i5.p1 TRINITY_DN67988_c3_g3~~TRINITY_DN67988_c3_g3_i5.p1  ORF type:complete len:456 (-),score=30.67 TRINITY_DN67988_c3_g3_i5:259-1626(-)
MGCVPTKTSGTNHDSSHCGVYSWGTGFDGQLGTGKAKNMLSPTRIKCLDDYVITALAVGQAHSMALIDGDVWTWGRGTFGQLGTSPTTTEGAVAEPLDDDEEQVAPQIPSQSTPQRIPPSFGERVSLIAAGANHSMAVAGSTLYTWGNGEHGQLGHGDTQTKYSPTAVKGSNKYNPITQIVTATDHNWLLTGTGRVYSWGCGTHGQLGQGGKTNVLRPTPVDGLDNPKIIAAGVTHSVALCTSSTGKNNRVFQCGKSLSGSVTSMVELEMFTDKNIQLVAAAGTHTVALTADWRMVSWGLENADDGYGRSTQSTPFGFFRWIDLPQAFLSPVTAQQTRLQSAKPQGTHSVPYSVDQSKDSKNSDQLDSDCDKIASLYTTRNSHLALTGSGTILRWEETVFGVVPVTVVPGKPVALLASGDHTLCYVAKYKQPARDYSTYNSGAELVAEDLDEFDV